MPATRASSFLEMIRRSQRGRLKLYLGFAPGVGKTYQMLQEGHRLKADGVDVVIGVVEHHGRAETITLIDGLDRVPMRHAEYHGITVEELDLDAVLARKPQVVLVDELAHTNIPGSRNAKRYEDVRTLVAAGIHVISTMNVQHLESLYDLVERLVGVKVRERVPDAVLAEADQVINVDLAAEDLQRRLRDGKIYPHERVAASLEHFFTESNLEHLRELTMRELASQLDLRRRETRPENGNAATAATDAAATEQIMVCLSSRGPNSARLLRFGSRLAGRLNRNWYAVYVQTPKEDPTVIDATTQRLLGDTLTLANQLGATVFTFKGTDVADTILRFAHEYRVGQVVIGSPRPIAWWRRVLGGRSVAEELITRQKDVTVIVVDADASDWSPSKDAKPAISLHPDQRIASTTASAAARSESELAAVLPVEHILILDEPVSRQDLLRRMICAAVVGTGIELPVDSLLKLVEERESRGSTFLNERIALPHARVQGLVTAVAALAVTRAGLLNAGDPPIDIAFLLLTPADGPNAHLRLLATAGRTLGDREQRRRLLSARSADAVREIVEGQHNIYVNALAEIKGAAI
ncbi:MAG: universal stress family proteinosmosensitive channel His kinase [Phycisphaerales bacterium]|nr:universal stress family proteinosmosensitive channel His kinase [Phycisphaerales bacterium]